MGFSFIHASDIHLSRAFSDLSLYSYNDKVKSLFNTAAEKAFNNLIDFAILKNVDFVLIAGDTFDNNEQDFKSKLIFKEGLDRLLKADIKVFAVCGNHDPVSAYNKNTFNFDESSNVKIIGLNTQANCKLKVLNKNNEEIAIIHALSYKDNTFMDNPVKYFSAPNNEEKRLFNIGLMHIDKDADKTSPYAPCSTGELQALEYDYTALGHIHVPDKGETKIQYSGTIQGRNVKETGPHGIRYLKVENNNIVKNMFVPIDVIRFEDLSIDLSHMKDITASFEYIISNISDFISVQHEKCELFLLRLKLIGCIDFLDELNDKFNTALTERIISGFYNKVCISKIDNCCIPKIDEVVLNSDEGISGEIFRTVKNDLTLDETVFSQIEHESASLLKLCDFDKDNYNEFKKEVINLARESVLNLCGKIYYNEVKEE